MSKIYSPRPADLATLDEETLALANSTMQLREANAAKIGQLERRGAGVDLGTARCEHLMVCLVDTGIVTEKQKWEFELAWQLELKRQVKGMIETINGIEQAQREEAAKPKLIIPGR